MYEIRLTENNEIMPEDSKKNQQKGKSEPKDQRKRRGRQHAASHEKKVEKEPPAPSKVTAPEKPAYEPPPPEFYQNLKRETDEILKITEEANSKYKKKEIQSNWAKYEMPIESYEDIDEQENLGADYEALSQAPLTVGGHFQFKHEKSWNINKGPSPYDKYFDINMDNLSIALSSIPFYERNSIDKSFFNENDIQSMNHRADKYKYKYYNDKKFVTPEIEVRDKLLDRLKDNFDSQISETVASNNDRNEKMLNEFKDINLEDCEQPVNIANSVSEHGEAENNIVTEHSNAMNVEKEATISEPVDHIQQTKDLIKEAEDIENHKVITTATITKEIENNKNIIIDNDFDELVQNDVANSESEQKSKEMPSAVKADLDRKPKEKESPAAPSLQKESSTKNLIIESPEDLEKWLDDFLDG